MDAGVPQQPHVKIALDRTSRIGICMLTEVQSLCHEKELLFEEWLGEITIEGPGGSSFGAGCQPQGSKQTKNSCG